jgi:Zn-dependent protease with chaperone function
MLPPKPSWHGATDLIGWCWRALGANFLHLYPAVHLVVATLMTLLIGRLSAVVLRHALRRQRRRRYHLEELRLISTNIDDHGVLLVPYNGPAAYSIEGNPGTIAITTGLRNRLSAAELDAVLHHERAHLLGRHHALLAALNALAAAFRLVPLFVRAAERAGLLIELVADAHAARRVGPQAVATALLAAAGGTGPPHSLAMSVNHLAVRLDELRRMGRHGNARASVQRSTSETRLLTGLAGTALAAALAGIAPALGVVASLLVTSCPTV